MTAVQDKPRLARHVRSQLSGLRWRIRAYVWVQGLALAAIWLCLTFWIGLGLDFLPILVGATEMPQAARAVLLATIALVLAVILYRWVLRRAFVRLANRSMAVLLERRFAGFHDGLVTAVEMLEHPDHAAEFSRPMLDQTCEEATREIKHVRLSRVFNYRPLAWSVMGALVLMVSVAGFAAASPQAFRTAFERLYLLYNTPWPRKARIEVVGIVTDRSSLPAESRSALPVIPFQGGVVKVARGSSVELIVRADASSRVSVVPDYCYLYYRTSKGDRGQARMAQLGRRENQFQNYSFRDQPFERIASTIDFDVVGYDHRLSNYRLELVNNPAVVKTTLNCEYPSYTGLRRDLDLPFTPGMKLPAGAKITIHCVANKPLTRVYVLDNTTHQVETLEVASGDVSPTAFDYQINALRESVALEFTLQDVDNVIGQENHRIYISATPDMAPQVTGRLRGVSSVITPDVVMPFSGTIADDFGVKQTWFRLERRIGKEEPEVFELPFDMGLRDADGKLIDPDGFQAAIDFREQRKSDSGAKLAPKDQLVVSLRARDNCELEQGPNVGAGDRLQFEVVTADELLIILEAREIGLRQRFEQILEEMTSSRDSLLRVRAELGDASPPDAIREPGDRSSEPGEKPFSPEEMKQRERGLRLLRVQQAATQSKKTSQEVFGVAESFSAIRLELINNRIDTADRKERLEVKIAQPLRDVVETMFPALDASLDQLEQVLEDDKQNLAAADAVVKTADDILAELNRVLQDMMDIEDYNELIDLVRSMIEDQKRLNEEAKKQRLKGLFDE